MCIYAYGHKYKHCKHMNFLYNYTRINPVHNHTRVSSSLPAPRFVHTLRLCFLLLTGVSRGWGVAQQQRFCLACVCKAVDYTPSTAKKEKQPNKTKPRVPAAPSAAQPSYVLVSFASLCIISKIILQAEEQPSGVECTLMAFSAAPAFSFLCTSILRTARRKLVSRLL